MSFMLRRMMLIHSSLYSSLAFALPLVRFLKRGKRREHAQSKTKNNNNNEKNNVLFVNNEPDTNMRLLKFLTFKSLKV